jgi:hypothetical protein
MKSISRIAAAIVILFLVAIAGIPHVSRMLISEAQAFRGRGAAFAVGAAVGSSSSSSSAEAATAQQQAATAQQQSATAQQQSATAQQQAAVAQQPAAAPIQQPAAASGNPLPLGTVVAALPAGCTPTPVSGVNYYYCGGSFYKAVYEGSTLKYVTTQPK